MTVVYTPKTLATNKLQQAVNQTAHGFTAGMIVINATLAGPPNWIKSQADSITNSFSSMMVSSIVDANNFVVTQVGRVVGLTNQVFIAGTYYYLSPTSSGNLTTTRPTAVGQVILGCFVADGVDSGYFFGGTGEVIQSGILFDWTTVNVNVANTGVNKGYFTSSGGTLNLTLPPSASIVVGDVLRVSNLAGQFSVLLNAGQTINYGNTIVATSLTSTAVGDSIELVCYSNTAGNAHLQTLSVIGNLNPV